MENTSLSAVTSSVPSAVRTVRYVREATVIDCSDCQDSNNYDNCPMCKGWKMDEGTKHDSGKLRFDLLPPDALTDLVRVYTVGAAKYQDRNWERGIKFCRIYAAIQRHLTAWMGGEEYDLEDGISHLSHAAWGCMALSAYSLRGMTSFDDRPGKENQ